MLLCSTTVTAVTMEESDGLFTSSMLEMEKQGRKGRYASMSGVTLSTKL